MNFPRPQSEEISINLTPLIDVVFLLLIFFMVSTTFTKETQLKVDLPQATTDQVAQVDMLEIIIKADGSFAINDKALVNAQPKTLRAALLKESSGDLTTPLKISADASTPHQAVITAMDVAANLGFSQLSLTTREID
ncbi:MULTISPECIES: biopolymer transporter ExbD [unclassified Marinobacterium]|uniref:ExbD/TolR family protein n=1 Tax=unclassified Marinobacterium TaxID=2644139 RepID=UPI001568C926|nr:Biopolymer transport protein ExbD [Marinobacterium sp. xm-a-152]NRP27657.1 Biopolymer transport protein ExbD [Marinobacterium sp. xm-d-420]NRP38759.1 Biopolymer transport protein ExbD [Marinobacterium sp. xm-a-121]NRP51625.1 Biopolymer transport protein ExbD [Marinobacterium sp. xm-v-242]NRP76206.1 Biopolymer transport protein ExbD [Marinobacterium sp. xm-m-383]NRP99575.1 Biopolymer transport protein ExbD [Marinobacterium sp. xm-v-233]